MRCEAHKLFADIAPEDASASRISAESRTTPRRRLRLAESHALRCVRASCAKSGRARGVCASRTPAGGTRRAIATTSKEAAKKSKRAAPAAAQTGIHDRNLGPAVVRRRGARGCDVLPARAEGAERWRRRGACRRRARRRGAEVSEAAAACGRRGAAEASCRVALALDKGCDGPACAD